MINHIESINSFLSIDKKLSNFSLMKYLDDEKVLKEKIQTLVEKTIKKKYLKFISINCWTYSSFYNDTLYSMSFEISLNYNINLFKLSFDKHNYNKFSFKTLFDSSFNDYVIKSNNKDINDFIILFDDIKNILIDKISNIKDGIGDDYNFFIENNKLKKDIKLNLLANTVYKKYDENKLMSLINSLIDFGNIRDYEFNVSISKCTDTKSKKGDVLFHFYLMPNNLLTNSTMSLCYITFNTIDLSFNIENKILNNSKYLKKSLDIKKKEKSINNYLLTLINN